MIVIHTWWIAAVSMAMFIWIGVTSLVIALMFGNDRAFIVGPIVGLLAVIFYILVMSGVVVFKSGF